MPAFDPSAKAATDGIYGLPFTQEQALVHYLPIPWDVTTSYGYGTHKGPAAIIKASHQMDLFDLEFGNVYEAGLCIHNEKKSLQALNKKSRLLAETIMDAPEDEVASSKLLQRNLKSVNAASEVLNKEVYEETKKLLKAEKIPVLVGGDHSTPFGAIKAYAEEFPKLGVLHFDAHSDTRDAYMGFEFSHASIIRNVAEKIPGVIKIVQVGIRDFCEEEYLYTKKHKKFEVFYDRELAKRKLQGESFQKIAREIVKCLPKEVYITLDIDVLDPKYCPHTGTPVPGGLEFYELLTIVQEILNQKKQILAFDLVEVAPHPKGQDEWDANVGMRLLYQLTGAMLKSRQ